MRESASLKNKAAVVGVATTKFGSFPDTDEYGLAAQAFRGALDDSGLTRDDIDGLVVCRIPSYARMGEVLGLDPRWTMTLPPHGRMCGIGIIEAVLALASGQANYGGAALCQYRPLPAGQLWRRRNAVGLGSLGLYLAGHGARADVPPAHGIIRHHDRASSPKYRSPSGTMPASIPMP